MARRPNDDDDDKHNDEYEDDDDRDEDERVLGLYCEIDNFVVCSLSKWLLGSYPQF